MKLDIIKTKDIYLKAFKYIVNNNKSNTLPYHNLEHIMVVFNNAFDAAQSYHLDEVIGEGATEELCLAALFHDTNHGTSKVDDNDNIENSIKLFIEFIQEYDKDINEEFVDNVCDIIESTKFPLEDIELNLQKKIIRDADILMREDNYLYTCVFALQEEFGVEDTLEKINNQIKFILNLKMNTDWGKSKWESKKGRVLSDLTYMKSIFKNDNYNKEERVDLEEDFVIINGKKHIKVEKRHIPSVPKEDRVQLNEGNKNFKNNE